MTRALSIFAAALLTLPAAALAQDAASGAAPTKAPATAAATAGHIPAAPAGKSQVVFFRTGAYMGGATWFKVRETGAELGKLSNQSYFVAVLDPGPHTFTSATENKTTLKMELDPGETYYVRGTLQMGLILYEPNLAPADQDLFEKHYAHMHAVRFVDPAAPKEPDAKDAPKPAS
jgi:hypothetical protein